MLLLFLTILFHTPNSDQHSQDAILELYIEANNKGSNAAFQSFIKNSYHPDLLDKIDMDKHVAFYQHVHADFEMLDPLVYETRTDTPEKLIVLLIKKGENHLNPSIDPANILVVELDFHSSKRTYLSRGLGLGALICERDKE